jgi:hypothetical protein
MPGEIETSPHFSDLPENPIHEVAQPRVLDEISAFCRSLVSSALRNVQSRIDRIHAPKPLQLLVAIREFGIRAAKGPVAYPSILIRRDAQNSDRGRMRPGRFGRQGCVAPIPKDACRGFEEARGEFFAYPSGHCEMSRRRRAGHIRQRRAGQAPRSRPDLSDSYTGSHGLTAG